MRGSWKSEGPGDMQGVFRTKEHEINRCVVTLPWSQTFSVVCNPHHCLCRELGWGKPTSEHWSSCKMWDNTMSVWFHLIREYDLTWHLDCICLKFLFNLAWPSLPFNRKHNLLTLIIMSDIFVLVTITSFYAILIRICFSILPFHSYILCLVFV